MDSDASLAAFFAGRRLLVTGASGFLGSHLCSRLLAGRAIIHAVSRSPRPSAHDNLRWWAVDVEQHDTVRKLVSEVSPDTVIHLGGLVNGTPDLDLIIPTFHSLLTSTVNLLAAAAELGCRRVLLVGSLEEPTGGGDEAYPTSPYGAAKWAASAYGRMFHHVFGVPVVIARTYMTYGPGQPSWKVIPSTILSLLRGEAPRLSSGRRKLDWVYVDDVVDGLLLAASTPDIEGATLDLGSGTMTTIREVVLELVELLAPEVHPVFNVLPDRPPGPERAADIAHTHAMTGWAPRTPLHAGLLRTIDWYRYHCAPPRPSVPSPSLPTQHA
jgi:nucleoside-diphosphate-sugar epimerase